MTHKDDSPGRHRSCQRYDTEESCPTCSDARERFAVWLSVGIIIAFAGLVATCLFFIVYGWIYEHSH